MASRLMAGWRERWVGWVGGMAVLLVVGYIGWFFYLLWTHFGGAIFGDPYTYLSFATNLARGDFLVKGALGEAVREFFADGELRLGPIWNTNVMPDGRTVFTVAIGFPLMLSQIIRWFGLACCMHANFLFLALCFLLVVWVGYEAFGRDRAALWIGLLGLLFFIATRTELFMRIAYLWREPFFFSLVLGGLVGVGHFLRTGRVVGLMTAAFLLGYAGSVKEANFLYGGAAALCVLFSRPFREHAHRGRLLVLCGVCGFLGVLPLFVQNYLATGNPLLSMQFARATAHYSLEEAGAGLSTGNTRETLRRYVLLYRDNPFFAWPFWGLFAAGVLRVRRRPLAGLLLVFGLMHFALYSQWGNADYRHMFFAHIPFALFVAAGFIGLAQWVGVRLRLPNLGWMFPGLAALGLFAVRPLPWTEPLDPAKHFKVSDAVRLADAMQAEIPAGSVLISNRVIRDIAAIYGGYEVVRMQDLKGFAPGKDHSEVIDWLLARKTGVYFLDNKDLDPANYHYPDWTLKDREMLLDRYDVYAAAEFDGRTYRIQEFLNRPVLTFWAVEPWMQERVERELACAGRPAFLYLQTRGAEDRIEVRLDGEPVALELPGYYHPVPAGVTGRDGFARLEVIATEGLIPRFADARLIGWWEGMRHELGYYGVPGDAPFFPDLSAADAEVAARTRAMEMPFRLRVPVRAGADSFTVIGLGVDQVSGQFGMRDAEGRAWVQPIARGATWFPVGMEVNEGFYNGMRELTLGTDVETDAGEVLSLSRMNAQVCRRRFEVEREGECATALVGVLHPTELGGGPAPWALLLDGVTVMEGESSFDPRAPINRFSHLIAADEMGSGALEFRGAGLTAWRWIGVDRKLRLEPGGDVAGAVLGRGYHPAENGPAGRFWWFPGEMTIRVPVVAGEREYRMQTRLASGHPAPGTERQLSIALEDGVPQSVPLPREVSTVEWRFTLDSAPESDGMAMIRLRCEEWSPAEVLPESADRRRLGFQLYRLEWSGVRPAGGGGLAQRRRGAEGE